MPVVAYSPQIPLNREGALLIACARRFVRQDLGDGVRAAFREDLDWDLLLRMADEQLVLPLLYFGLEFECPGRAPQELRARFQDRARFNLLQTAELVRVLELLEQNRIPAVPLKGPILAAWAYGDLALRASLDLDLLIRREHVLAAMALLTQEGYQLTSEIHWSCARACLRSKDSQLSFAHSDTGVSLDLHWALLPDDFVPSFDGDCVWENLASVPLAGRNVPALSTEDLVLFLCAHGSKHRWACLGWICDIALVLKRAEIDWASLLSRAQRAHIERMVLLGLRLAGDIFETVLPDAVKERVDAEPKVIAISNEVRDRILEGSATGRSAVSAYRMNLRMLERIRDKIRYLASILFTPGETEWRHVSLPPALYFLYYPYRLMRLVGKYAGGRQIVLDR